MTRIKNWEPKFYEAIEAFKDKPFKWGEFDCVTFAADVVLAITGIDYIEPYRRKYASKKEAYQIIREKHGTISDAIGMHFDAIPILSAKRGDVLLYNKSVGICDGASGIFITPKGVRSIPITMVEQAWQV